MTTRRAARARRIKSASNKRYAATPGGAYAHAKARAKHRGVPFELTFAQWWRIWDESGHWAERGNRYGQYNMLRRGDEGAYAEANVYIGTHEANVAERNTTVAVRRRAWSEPGTVEIVGDDCPF